jgi:DNA-binding MarR family transcriptional regulator
MGDLASALPALPSRLTRQIRRLETQELVERGASPEDRRGVLATITDKGRNLGEHAMVTYAHDVRTDFLGPLPRPQIGAMEDTCQRINAPLKRAERAAKDR